MKWEYKIIDLGSKSGLIKEGVIRDVTKRIVRLGEEGWELVGLVPMYVHAGLTGYSITQALMLFKRPMKEKADKKEANNGFQGQEERQETETGQGQEGRQEEIGR
jgi:hypothetical protein